MTQTTDVDLAAPLTQQARIDAMRARLLDATADCLVELGYSGMSTNDVVRRAGVSRGALAHHFPAKADLVAAAAQRLVAGQADEFRRRFRELPPKRRTIAGAMDVLWACYETPTFVALLELTVAARSNADLRAVLADEPDHIAELAHAIFGEFFPELAGRPYAEEAVRGLMAMFTGLALQTFVDGDAHGRHAAVRALLSGALSALATRRQA
jgi:AcrR family transcriptional regulator